VEYGGLLVETLIILGLVCALAWAAIKFGLRRTLPPAMGPLKIVARLPLEPRRTVYIIEAAGKTLLVGVGDGPMQTLAELDADAVASAKAAEPPRRTFLEVLRGQK
jgi:flagellar biosynthetic protein FliO